MHKLVSMQRPTAEAPRRSYCPQIAEKPECAASAKQFTPHWHALPPACPMGDSKCIPALFCMPCLQARLSQHSLGFDLHPSYHNHEQAGPKLQQSCRPPQPQSTRYTTRYARTPTYKPRFHPVLVYTNTGWCISQGRLRCVGACSKVGTYVLAYVVTCTC
jgi:hypothetical protein